jgi:hypothetical protein
VRKDPAKLKVIELADRQALSEVRFPLDLARRLGFVAGTDGRLVRGVDLETAALGRRALPT